MDTPELPEFDLPADFEPLPGEGATLRYRRRVEQRGWLLLLTVLWSAATVWALTVRFSPPGRAADFFDLWMLLLIGMAVWLVGFAVWAVAGWEEWRFAPGCIEVRRSLWGIHHGERILPGVLEIERSSGGGAAVSRSRLSVFDGHRSWCIVEDRFADAPRLCALKLSEYTRFPVRTRS